MMREMVLVVEMTGREGMEYVEIPIHLLIM
jgi:hypothetical protein